MSLKTYQASDFDSWDDFEFKADFAQASSTIYVRWRKDDPWQPTPFQVADVNHDPMQAWNTLTNWT